MSNFQISKPIDIILSHDWPRGITKFGDEEKLFSVKTFLRQEVV
jgi:lariat debranching enzyme